MGLLECDTYEVLSLKFLGATSLLGPVTRAKPGYYRSMWLVVYCMGPEISLRILAGSLKSLVSERSPGRRDVCSAKSETEYSDKKIIIIINKLYYLIATILFVESFGDNL